MPLLIQGPRRTAKKQRSIMNLRSTVKVLLVDDFAPFRQSVCSILQGRPEFKIVAEACDGLEAVQIAQELQPGLILLDLALPKLNGLEATHRIRNCAPNAKILIVSTHCSPEHAQQALRIGAMGYVVKSDIGNELLPAMKTALRGDLFVSSSLTGRTLVNPSGKQSARCCQAERQSQRSGRQDIALIRCHEVAFYADDKCLVDGFSRFVEAALTVGNAVIVLATESHHASLVQKLKADGVNIGEAIQDGSYLALDVADTLSNYMTGGRPNLVQFNKAVGDLIARTQKAAAGKGGRVVACGEGAPILLRNGNPDAAVQLEYLCNEIASRYDIDILCGYSSDDFQDTQNFHVFERICAAHSAVRTD